jgi:hypothetical protein
LADPIGLAQQVIFDTGTKIGELARNVYPGGALIKENHFQHEQAVITTQKVLQNTLIPIIYEAAFMHDDIRIRADILVRTNDGRFDLVEMKSTTKTKEEHILDIAIQLYVLHGCGINIGRASLGHLDSEYVYRGEDYELDKLFQIDDITIAAKDKLPEVVLKLRDMREMLYKTEPPDIKVGRQCSNPYDCAFQGHCYASLPEHYILQLPRVSKEVMDTLNADDIEDIRDIPIDFAGLNAAQQRVRDCVVNNRIYLDTDITGELNQLVYPIHFLDFETFNPALPLYIGTSPYKAIPFQWSNHILNGDGSIRHEEFLHDGFDDPRVEFARTLLQTLGNEGSIVVYSSFEASRIKELMQALPQLSDELNKLLIRIVDLLKLIRTHCYHPEFHGSFSIKSVLPVLVPGLDYSDLEINDGGLASTAYAEIVHPDTTQERRDHLRKCLLDYCERDTEAEVRLFQTLKSIV